MKKLLAMLVFAGFLSAAAPAALRAQDDDHGRHRGWYKHGRSGLARCRKDPTRIMLYT